MKKIAIFNHKGGVSKTTTAFNIGWMLSRKGKKVILIDADSQCNLTLYSLGYKAFSNFYESGNKNNIKDGLDPAFSAKPNLIQPIECLSVKKNVDLLLLPGHLDLTEYEVSLGVSFNFSNAFGVMKNLPGALNYLIEVTSKKYNADFVIIDMNPSLSSINQDILLSSDYFIVPTSPDLFSLMAIKSLARILPTWERWAKSARPIFKDAEYPLYKRTPKFLGYTINDFNLSYGEPTKSFADIMNRISYAVENELIPALMKEKMTLDMEKYKEAWKIQKELRKQRDTDSYCLAEISNFNKLIAISNKTSIPIFELSANKLPFKGQIRTLNWFKKLFDVLSRKIIYLSNE